MLVCWDVTSCHWMNECGAFIFWGQGLPDLQRQALCANQMLHANAIKTLSILIDSNTHKTISCISGTISSNNSLLSP